MRCCVRIGPFPVISHFFVISLSLSLSPFATLLHSEEIEERVVHRAFSDFALSLLPSGASIFYGLSLVGHDSGPRWPDLQRSFPIDCACGTKLARRSDRPCSGWDDPPIA